MVSLSPFFQTAVIGWGEAGKQNHWEKARPVKGLTRGNGAGAVNPGSLSYPRQEGRLPSYAIMEIDRKEKVHFTIAYLR